MYSNIRSGQVAERSQVATICDHIEVHRGKPGRRDPARLPTAALAAAAAAATDESGDKKH